MSHEGGAWMNDDQRGYYRDLANQKEKEQVSKTDQPAPKRMNVADAEIQAMAKILTILNELDDSEQTRILAWLLARKTPGKFKLILGTDDSQPSQGQP